MKYENSPEEEIEATLFALHAERDDFWLGLRARVRRTGGRDAQLNRLYEDSNARMDALLDKYSGQLAMQECFDNLVVVGDVVT